MPTQCIYGPAPVVESNIGYIAGACTKSTNDYISEISSINNDLTDFYNNSFYIRGSFGEALSYFTRCKIEDIKALQKHGQDNFLIAMQKADTYDYNINNIKTMVSKVYDDISSDSIIGANGNLLLPETEINEDNASIIKIAKETNSENQKLKKEIEELSSNNIY